MLSRIALASVLIAIGFYLGWTLKPNSIHHEPIVSETDAGLVLGTKESDDLLPIANEVLVDNNETHRTSNAANSEFAIQGEQAGSALDKFMRLLAQNRANDAVEYFREIERTQTGLALRLKLALLQFLDLKLKQLDLHTFSNITEYWLNTYYNDIDVLIRLAKYNSLQNYYGEAIGVFQLAYSYALGDGEIAEIDEAFFEFVYARDARLVEKEAWFELQSFYEMLDQAGIAKPDNRFRLAEIYLYNGLPSDAMYVAEQLQSSHRFSSKATKMLDQIAKGEIEKRPFRRLNSQAISLTKHGNHFIAKLNLQNGHTLNLLIDTGASITSVSKHAFDTKIGYHGHTLLPARLFRTANGITRNEIVRVSATYLGSFQLRDTEIAIAALPDDELIDGLLGMNILSQFRFHIDQEAGELILASRE